MPYYPNRLPAREPEQPPREKEKSVRRLLAVAAAGLLVYGGVRLTLYGMDAVNAGRVSGELRQVYSGETMEAPEEGEKPAELPAKQETAATDFPGSENGATGGKPADSAAPEPAREYAAYSGNPNLAVSEELQRLRRKNTDIVGWLEMDGLAEAVVQRDNTFYLNHDALGKRNYSGAIFLDEGISLTVRPQTLMLYGHNMKTGAMFGTLKEYRKARYFVSHRFITFNSMYEDGRYVVFAAGDVRLMNGTRHYVNLAGLLSDSRETRGKALKELCAAALHGVVIDVNEEDQLLLLITCTADDDERFVVAARRLRDGESESRITPKT